MPRLSLQKPDADRTGWCITMIFAFRNPTPRAATVSCCAMGFLATVMAYGCRSSNVEPPQESPSRSPRVDSQPTSGPAVRDVKPPDSTTLDSPLPVPERPVPPGRPAPTAQCGHAVAFAGWRPDPSAVRDVLLICDPGDNSLENVRHVWVGRPRELPVHFGRQRPAVVLQPAGGFTITGAVVIAPRSALPGSVRMAETRTAGMPDLSQDLSPRWPGLCAPTSAADVLFTLRDPGEGLRARLPRGPDPEADAAVVKLVAGRLERITPDSLAGRMGVGQDGIGATNDGMRRGLDAWLNATSPDRWDVTLDWFDDCEGDRRRAEQRAFFGRLAAAVEAGGGAIICLWPGTEFAENPVGPNDALASDDPASEATPPRSAGGPLQSPGDSVPLPEAAFPAIPAAPRQSQSLPGRKAPLDPATAVQQAEQKLEQAHEKLDRGRAEDALELAAEAVSLLHEASRFDPAIRPRLTLAIALCRECDAQIPPRRRADPHKPTQYE